MSQISSSEAIDLLSKLFSERIPLRAFFISPSRVRVSMPGFVDSITESNGLGISVSGPPIEVARGYFNIRPFDRECEFWYGEKREMSEELRQQTQGSDGESALIMRFLETGDLFSLFFTL